MIKSELVARLAATNPHLRQRDMEAVVAAILGTMADALVRGDRVEIRGFCALSIRRQRAHVSRNPRTGVAVAVAARAAIRCTTGQELILRLNPDLPTPRYRRTRRTAARAERP